MRGLSLVVFSVLGVLTAASAQEFTAETELPALFDVAGVEASDVLNVRAEPSAAAEIIGTFASDAGSIEVVAFSPDRRWGLVNLAESAGYVSMSYLQQRPAEFGPEGLPPTLSCFGTEPFWSLSWNEGELSLSTPEDGEQPLSLDRRLPLANLPQPNHVLFADKGEARYIGVIGRAECSDGMSDRRYGLTITLIEDSVSAWAASGCCSLQ